MPPQTLPPLAIIGLGYVGLPLAVEFGKIRPVIGFDINTARVAELQSGRDHTLECSAEELAQATQLRYTADAAELAQAQIYIVTVPTPVDTAKRPDLSPLVKASTIRVAEAAKVIENTQRDVNIALMNELSLIFSKLGIDTLQVLEAAGTKWNFLPFLRGDSSLGWGEYGVV